MFEFPKDAMGFQDAFGTNAQCRVAIAEHRWPQGFVCPNCGHDDGYELTSRGLIQCCLCRHQTSVTAGTMFHKTHLPLREWFWIMYQMCHDKGGASATRLAEQLNRPYKTIWHVLHKLRHAMKTRDSRIMLSGLIEMDEAVLGPEARRPSNDDRDDDPPPSGTRKKPNKRPWGRKKKNTTKRKKVTDVLVLAEAEHFHIGNIALKTLPDKTMDTLNEVIPACVEENQWFRTDAYDSHWVLRNLAGRFTIKKSSEAQGCEALPAAHRVISLLKHFLVGTFYGVSTKYLPGYLEEFSFRFIRRESQSTLCQSLLRACIFTVPMTYAELKL
jgi:hypothetical protein